MIHRAKAAAALTTAALVALSGCASGPGPYGQRYETPVPEGSTLVLERSLDLATGASRVFLQEGRVVPDRLLGGFDRFRPLCSFGVKRARNEQPIGEIESDRFRTGEPYTHAHTRAEPPAGILVAGPVSSLRVADMGGGPFLGYLTFEIEIPLSSRRQPQVHDFICRVDRDPTWDGRLGLESIRQAVGDIVRIELAESDSETDTESGY